MRDIQDRAEAEDEAYQRAIRANVCWFTQQVCQQYQPPAQVELFRDALSDAALLEPVADRMRQLLGMLLNREYLGAVHLANQWVKDAATAYAEREWERSDDREEVRHES